MKYTQEQRLKIGKRIYDGEITRYQAALEYGIGDCTARDYMRLYRDFNHLPEKRPSPGVRTLAIRKAIGEPVMKQYESMTREQLLKELIKTKLALGRAKKGYEVKGVGAEKEFLPLGTSTD